MQCVPEWHMMLFVQEDNLNRLHGYNYSFTLTGGCIVVQRAYLVVPLYQYS